MSASMSSLACMFIWPPKQITLHQLYGTSSGFAQNLLLLEGSAMWVLSSLLLCSHQHLCLKCAIPAFAVFLFADSLRIV